MDNHGSRGQDIKNRQKQPAAPPPVSRRRGRRLRWLIGIFIAGVMLYALAGFFLAPWLIERQLRAFVEESLDRRVSVDKVKVNPFSLTLTLGGFRLDEPEGSPILRFEELYLNLQVSSLFRWAWTLDEIRLTGPSLNLARHGDGVLNLEALLADWRAASRPAPALPEEEAGLPPLYVGWLVVEKGELDIVDRSRATDFETRLGPIGFSLGGFSTHMDGEAEHILEAETESGARLVWSGKLALRPLGLSGHISLVSEELRLPWRYVQDDVHFEITRGASNLELDYAVTETDASLAVDLTNLSFDLSDLDLQLKDDSREIIQVPSLAIAGGHVAWPGRTVTLDSVKLSGSRLLVRREKDGSLDFARLWRGRPAIEPLLQPGSASAGGGGTDSSPPAWDSPAGAATGADDPTPVAADPTAGAGVLADWLIAVSRLEVEDLGLLMEDHTPAEPAVIDVADLDLSVGGWSSAPGTLSPFDLSLVMANGGSVTLRGEMGVIPLALDAKVVVDGLSPLPGQPFLGEFARLRFNSGTIGFTGRAVSNGEETLRILGDGELRDFSLHEASTDERFLAWEGLSIDELLLELDARRFQIAGIDLMAPYVRLNIARDGSTNIGDILQPAGEPAGETAPAEQAASAEASGRVSKEAAGSRGASTAPLAYAVGRVGIHDGSADFSDLTLPLPFAAKIHSMNGEIAGITSDAAVPAEVSLEGTVDEYGLSRVGGRISLTAPEEDSALDVLFRNIEMASLTPYTMQFVGYTVEEGRLSLDLTYQMTGGRLESQNRIVIEELTLGDEVESESGLKLPVRMAVALLKDSQGRITLDVPVSGSLDDPEFGYGKVARQAIGQIMKKAVTAPFRLLGRLVGGGGDDFEFVQFDPGRAELLPPEREKLARLAQALNQRPELILEVRGAYARDLDEPAIREARLEALVTGRVESAQAQQPKTQEGDTLVLPQQWRREALESLFLESHTQEDLATLKESFLAIPEAADGPGARSGQVAATPAGQEGTGESGQAASAEDGAGVPVLDESGYSQALRQALLADQVVSDDDMVSLAGGRAGSVSEYLLLQDGIIPDRVRTLEVGKAKKSTDRAVLMKLGLGAR